MLRQIFGVALLGSFVYLRVLPVQCNNTAGITSAEILYDKLLSNYNKAIRPIPADAGPTTIRLSLRFRYLIDLDERHQMLKGVSWIYERWTDPRLRWEPRDHNDTELIVTKLDQIWWPQLIFNNDASGNYQIIGSYETDNMDAIIYSDGEVYMSFPVMLTTFCEVHITNFPFDSQTCPLRIAPTGVPSTILKVEKGTDVDGAAMLDAVTRNGQWNIVDIRAYADYEIHKTAYPPSGEDDVSSLIFEIDLCRKPDYYSLTIVLPATIIMTMTLFVFFIPVDSGERLSFITALVLAVMIFQLFVEEALPKVSERPLLGLYVIGIFLAQVIIVAVSVVSVCLVHKTNRGVPAPPWISYIAMFCNKYICFMKKSTIHSNSKLGGEGGSIKMNITLQDRGSALMDGDSTPTRMGMSKPPVVQTDWENWRTVAGGLDMVFGTITLIVIVISILFLIINQMLYNCVDYRDA